MIPWWYLLPALCLGVLLGVFVGALMAASAERERAWHG